MRFHVLGLHHTISSSKWNFCAHTAKLVKFCKMMASLGHEIYHYGHPQSEVECTENIPVISKELFKTVYGVTLEDCQSLAKIHHRIMLDERLHPVFDNNTVREILKRWQPDDFLLMFWGQGHVRIATAILEHQPDAFVVEPGVGYYKTAAHYRVFESHAVANYVYGLEEGRKEALGDDYTSHLSDISFCPQTSWVRDAVIPICFDPDEFDYNPTQKSDYHFYIGRMIKNKGIETAVDATALAGKRLVVAGSGNNLQDVLGGEIPKHVTFVGPADLEKRKSLLSKAAALWAPTRYLEPFGKIVVEAQISGTPVISSDGGAFAETNLHGVTGYRCRTFNEYVWAAKNIHQISPEICRNWALENYSMERLAPMHEEYYMNLIEQKYYGDKMVDPAKITMDIPKRYFPFSHKHDPVSNLTNKKIAVIFFSCGKPDLLAQTLESWHQNVSFDGTGEVYKILIDDMPDNRDRKALGKLSKKYNFDRVLLNKENLGIDGSIRRAWGAVPEDTDYIWHQEDDFLFRESVSVADMITDLETCPVRLEQIVLPRQLVYDWEKERGTLLWQEDNRLFCWDYRGTRREVVARQHHFSFNPCVYRAELTRLKIGYLPHETTISWALLQRDPNCAFGVYTDRKMFEQWDDNLALVTHIGEHDKVRGQKITDDLYDWSKERYKPLPPDKWRDVEKNTNSEKPIGGAFSRHSSRVVAPGIKAVQRRSCCGK